MQALSGRNQVLLWFTLLYPGDHGNARITCNSSPLRAKGDAGVASFILYGTSACHLCEIAEEMIAAETERGSQPAVAKVDISDSDELVERYGTRIPVLRHPDGRELGWPFDRDRLRAFLGS